MRPCSRTIARRAGSRPSRRRATGRGTSTLITITSLRPATAAERAACQPPREVEDTDFATDVESALTVKRAPSGHLLVPVKVNGEAVGWFVFDTGAGQTCIDLALAERLGLDQQRGVQAVGVGGATAASLCRARTFTIGPMTMENPRLIGLDLQPLSKSMGEGIAGVCGYDVFRRSVVVVDMRDAKIELYPPG
ncbi:MAG: retropepsin-like aspartic protease [Planctomycetota bacterium]